MHEGRSEILTEQILRIRSIFRSDAQEPQGCDAASHDMKNVEAALPA
jgi:hypothetical protein